MESGGQVLGKAVTCCLRPTETQTTPQAVQFAPSQERWGLTQGKGMKEGIWGSEALSGVPCLPTSLPFAQPSPLSNSPLLLPRPQLSFCSSLLHFAHANDKVLIAGH